MKNGKVLMKGTDAIAEAAVRAGCRCFFGYPITPANEVPEYMSWRMQEVDGVFIQAESEIGAINMIAGASGSGKRAMTATSGPGMSLKQEGIANLAIGELPAVIVNIMRAGPALGNIGAGQCDYFQSVRGGGNGDYNSIVLAPNSVQESIDLTFRSFDLADKFLNPVILLLDGCIGQMMEGVVLPEYINPRPHKNCAKGAGEGTRTVISPSLFKPRELEEQNKKMQAKYQQIKDEEQRWEYFYAEDAEILVIAYGVTSRIVKGTVRRLRKEGKKVGLLRPISLWPFPEKAFEDLSPSLKKILVVEMSAGQMVQDVRLVIGKNKPVYLLGRTGGSIPSQEEIYGSIMQLWEKEDIDDGSSI